ncbi:MAG: response regulator [Chlorobi bacterium]|nr:response regulator [Chlorobiota bacterium]
MAIRNIVFFILVFLIFEGSAGQNISADLDTAFNYDEQFKLAKSMHKKAKVAEAVNIHYSILDFLQKHKDDTEEYYTRLAENYQSLTNLYVFENDSLSLVYANKAIEAAAKTSDLGLLERSYSFKYYSLYNVPGSAKQLDAIADKCIEYSLIVGSKEMLGEAYMHKCNALVELNRIEEGNDYCKKAEAIFMDIESGYFLSAVLGNIANVFVKSNQPEKALYYHLKSYNISKNLDNLTYLLSDVQNLAQDYYNIGDYKKSSEFYKILTDSMEVSYETKLDERFTDSEAKFNAEQKDKEIALQKLEIAERKKARDRIIFGGVIVLLLVVGFFQWYLLKHRKKKQQAEQELRKEQELNDLRKRFLENIAHEIRTPITIINGHLELAMEAVEKNSRLSRHIKTAINNSGKILDNANEILELLKLENDNPPLTKSEIILDSFFKRIFFSFESLAELKKIKLEYISELKPEMAINSDKERIEKILNNFMSNAIKFSPSNAKIVFEAAAANGAVTVKVTDFGPGISVSDQQKVFDRFYQASNTTNIGGMGIGLSLANELANSLGASLSIDSKIGKGSTFIFKLKAGIYFATPDSQTSDLRDENVSKKTISINPHDKTKILIVEDNPEMNDYLTEILSEQYSCDVAFDGIEGLQKVQTKKYALIISDVMMPHLNGYELKQKINNIDNCKNIPFVFLTAKVQLEGRIEGYDLGIDDYITKPFAKEELMARVSALLHNKKERDKWAMENPDFVEDNKNEEDILLGKIKTAIRENISDEDFKVPDLAKKVAYSSRQLSRLTKKSSGLTPLQFILEMRLQKAYTYLSEKRFATIAEVRNKVGMPGAAHFNKKFTERFGIRPTDVLNKN